MGKASVVATLLEINKKQTNGGQAGCFSFLLFAVA